MGSDIGSGPARSVVYVRYSLDKNFSNNFNLNKKTMGHIHNNTYRLPHKIFVFDSGLFGFFFPNFFVIFYYLFRRCDLLVLVNQRILKDIPFSKNAFVLFITL